MVLVRLLLFLALAAIGVALFLFLLTRDRRYLAFIVKVVKFSLIALGIVLVYFAAERLLAPMLGPLL